MWMYLKTIESLDNISPCVELTMLIGTIKNLKNTAFGGEGEFQFTLYSDDTEISLECELNKGNLEAHNTHYKNGDTVIVSGRYHDGTLLVYGLSYAPLGLTGNMSKDVLIFHNEMHDLLSIQGQNGYISSDAWLELQELSFKFKRHYEDITGLGY